MDAAAWDSRYQSSDLLWGADPNQFVASELEDEPPGRALDVACGEGRNAIWLATRGWDAVGVDFSRVGLERAAELAARAGAADRVRFVLADVVNDPLPPGPFQAVVVAYLHLTPVHRRQVTSAAARELGPGGLLLVIGHDSTNLTSGVGGPQDPEVLFTPDDVLNDLSGAGLLGGGGGGSAGGIRLAVEKAERAYRKVSTPDGERQAIDALVRVRRTV